MGTQRWGVTAAAVDTAHASVVKVGGDDLNPCSGTVIAPRTIITAAHCTAGRGPTWARFDDGSQIAITRFTRAPGFEPASLAADVALLELADDAHAPAVPFGQVGSVGALVTVVGFGRGRIDEPRFDVRRAGVARVDAVAVDEFRLSPAPSLPCSGDSGGAVFVEGGLVGVISSGDATCSNRARAVRLDGETGAWVSEHLATPPGCSTARAAGTCSATQWALLLMLLVLTRRSRAPGRLPIG